MIISVCCDRIIFRDARIVVLTCSRWLRLRLGGRGRGREIKRKAKKDEEERRGRTFPETVSKTKAVREVHFLRTVHPRVSGRDGQQCTWEPKA